MFGRVATRSKPTIFRLARIITIGPNPQQVALQKAVEPSLTEITRSLVTLAAEANHITAHGVKLNIDAELRSIIGKAYAARKKAAKAIYVATDADHDE